MERIADKLERGCRTEQRLGFKDANDFLDELRNHLKDLLNTNGALYFDELSDEEKKQLTASLIQHGIDLSSIGSLKENGEFLLYAPYSFLLTLYHETPDSFFGGGIWSVSLASGGEELLGSDNVHVQEKKLYDSMRIPCRM